MVKKRLVLVVDDEISITKIISSYLERAGYEMICAYDGLDALNLFEKYDPALIILDLMLPGLSGEQVCLSIRKKSRVPVIMLTAKTTEDDILTGLRLGADDYLKKPFSPRELVARVETVMRRTAADSTMFSEPLVFHNRDLVIDPQRHEARISGGRVPLTPKEFAILSAMAKYPTKVFTRDELISLALGDDYDGFNRVIDTHIKNLRQKIEISGHKYIKTIHGVGYTFDGE